MLRHTKVIFSSLLLATACCAMPAATQAQQVPQDNFWQTRCAGPSKAPETLACEASQSLRVKESGHLLFKIDIVYPANNAAPVLQIQAPLGFYLPGKIKLAVDGTPISDLEVKSCDQRGCFLSSPAKPEMINAMKAGGKLEIDFAPAADKRQKIEVPLTGFSRAIASIQ